MMSEQQVELSFCVPVFNAEAHVAATVQCLLDQCGMAGEVVVVDDGSTDASLAVLENLAARDPRLKVFAQPNAGAAAARNRAARRATGRWIWFFDADDYLWPGSAEVVLAAARTQPEHMIATSWLKFQGTPPTAPRPWPESLQPNGTGVDWLLHRWLRTTSCTYPGSFCIPTTLAKKVSWNESLTVLDDMPFYTSVLVRSAGVVQVPEAVFGYRQPGPGNLSNRGGRRFAESALRATEEAVEALLAAEDSARTRRASANQLMLLAYATYVHERDVAEAASRRARSLARADIRFPGGVGRRLLMHGLGWRRGLVCHQRLRSFAERILRSSA